MYRSVFYRYLVGLRLCAIPRSKCQIREYSLIRRRFFGQILVYWVYFFSKKYSTLVYWEYLEPNIYFISLSKSKLCWIDNNLFYVIRLFFYPEVVRQNDSGSGSGRIHTFSPDTEKKKKDHGSRLWNRHNVWQFCNTKIIEKYTLKYVLFIQ